MALYLLTFCRVVICLTFAVSSFSKTLNVPKFKQTVISFNLLPRRLSGIIAILFIFCEYIVTGLIFIGGKLLLPGFLLAILLLLIFCSALAFVLLKRLSVPCNCFGSSEKPDTFSDIWRNIGFILCALVGCIVFVWSQHIAEHLGIGEGIITGVGAVVFVVIWIQLDEIVQIFRSS